MHHASAMMMEFNCWEIWLMGWVKLLDSCRKCCDRAQRQTAAV